ncbi:36474_t:CDS:2, partial [Racocetra persica]
LTQYANTQEASTKGMNLSTNRRKRGIDVIDNEENGSHKKKNTKNDADNNENFPSRNNNENSSSGFEDEEINFDLTDISKELNREPTVKICFVSNIDFLSPVSH